jgi:transcriptional regulator with XRE-family HTH domain
MTDFKKEYRKLVSKVIAARKRCGRSQIAVCKEAGISQAGWWEVEAGVNLPKVENLAAIASVLGFQVELSLSKNALKKDPA